MGRSMRCVVERGGGGEVYEVCSGEGGVGKAQLILTQAINCFMTGYCSGD